MRIFAVSDLLLGSYGPVEWLQGLDRLALHWDRVVTSDDVVVIPGGFSVAENLREVEASLLWLASRPGRVFVGASRTDRWYSGNYLYVHRALPLNITLLNTEAALIDGGRIALVVGRGRIAPGMPWWQPARDERVYKLYIKRLCKALRTIQQAPVKIVALHEPPYGDRAGPLVCAMAGHRVNYVLYGSLTGPQHRLAVDDKRWGMEFRCVSTDYIKFYPRLIVDTKQEFPYLYEGCDQNVDYCN